MDALWTRLLGSSPSAERHARGRNETARAPERVENLKAAFQVVQSRQQASGAEASQQALRDAIHRVMQPLLQEVQRSDSDICLRFALSNGVFTKISYLAALHSPLIVKEIVASFVTFLDTVDEDVFLQKAISRSLDDLIRAVIARQEDRHVYEEDFIELVFGVCAKFRVHPQILVHWFAGVEGTDGDYQGSLREFPIFHFLLDYVHCDGRVGDFARLGLLYIIEATTGSPLYGHWLLTVDLATLMASGLGALYAQLSRNFVISDASNDEPLVVALSDDRKSKEAWDAEQFTRVEFGQHVKTFIAYLQFWQDALNRCRSATVKQNLLQNFQTIFLEQLLYPSLLETSDQEGSSAVAALTYVRVLVDHVRQADFIDIILGYLLAAPSFTSTDSTLYNPDAFTLLDLITSNLRSTPPIISATLRLTASLLRGQHLHVSQLFVRSFAMHVDRAHVDLHMPIPEDSGSLAMAYSSYVKNAAVMLENHPSFDLAHRIDIGALQTDMHFSLCRSVLLHELLRLQRTFFTNAVSVNLSLTFVFVNLACCSIVSMDWLSEGGFNGLLQDQRREVRTFQSDIPNFEELMEQREQAILFAQELAEALQPDREKCTPEPTTPTKAVGAQSRTSTPTKRPLARRTPQRPTKSTMRSTPVTEHIQGTKRLVPWGDMSLSHLLSNIFLFREFVKEITALVQVRGALEEEAMRDEM